MFYRIGTRLRYRFVDRAIEQGASILRVFDLRKLSAPEGAKVEIINPRSRRRKVARTWGDGKPRRGNPARVPQALVFLPYDPISEAIRHNTIKVP